MEYIYAVMLLNKAGKPVDETHVTAVLKAAGVNADAQKVKALVSALDGVKIEEVIASATLATGGAGAPAAAAPAAAKKEEKKKEPEVDAAAGLGSLF